MSRNSPTMHATRSPYDGLPLGPLPPVRDRLLQHILSARDVVSSWIVFDRSHGDEISFERIQFEHELERAAVSLVNRSRGAELRSSWADSAVAATHDYLHPQLGHCPRCDQIDWVQAHPGERFPKRIPLLPPVSPPKQIDLITRESRHLPRMRTEVARSVAQADAHGDPDQLARSVRHLTMLEEGLAQRHLALTLRLLPAWIVVESSWQSQQSAMHHGCMLCWRETHPLEVQ